MLIVSCECLEHPLHFFGSMVVQEEGPLRSLHTCLEDVFKFAYFKASHQLHIPHNSLFVKPQSLK